MGNTESNVTSGVKKQAGASMQAIYKLCDLKGKSAKMWSMRQETLFQPTTQTLENYFVQSTTI